MQFFRNERGYFFSNGLVKLVWFYRGQYSIQMVVPGIFVWTIYKGEKRPEFRNLYAYSLLLPFVVCVVTFMYLVVVVFTGLAIIFSMFEKLLGWMIDTALYPIGLLEGSVRLTFAHDGIDMLVKLTHRFIAAMKRLDGKQ